MRRKRNGGVCAAALCGAMALVVAGLLAEGETVVEDIGCIATSYPDFVPACRRLAGDACIEVSG